jgi:hypothetical protein
MATQWHPLFARLLGVQLGEFYEIQTEVSVSDLPRRGDILIVRRQPGPEPPFRGLWNYLADWNVLEFKGPTEYPEVDDLELLAHVGTGLTYKLNEERRVRNESRLEARQVSLWYIARTLGDTFLDEARARSSPKYEGGGLWSCRCWGHPVYLVSARDLPVEEDTVPLWLVEGDPAPRALGELVAHRDELLKRFATWFRALQPKLWEEVRAMAGTSGVIDWEKVAQTGDDVVEIVRYLPPERVIQVLGAEQAIQVIGPDKFIEAVGADKALDALLARVTPEQLQEMLKRRQEKG